MGRSIVINDCYGGYGLSDKAVKMLQDRGYAYNEYDMCYYVPRHNKDLVEIVNLLGQEASGDCAYLKIHHLPDNCRIYKITEYDGLENVEYITDTDYIIIDD